METSTKLESKITIGPVRMSYAHVFEPRENELSNKNEYSCVCLIPKEPNDKNTNPKAGMKAFSDLVKLVAAEAKLKGDWKNPIRDGDTDLNKNGEPKHPGYWFITAKTGEDYPPMVVNATRAPIGKESGWVSGDWAKVRVNVKAYEAAGNKGVTCYLVGVQWLHKDEPFGGDPLDGFDDESGGSGGSGDPYDPFAD